MWCANPRLYRQVPGVFPPARRDLRIPRRLVRSSRPLYFGFQRSIRRGHWASLFSLPANSGPTEFRLRPPPRQARAGGAGLIRTATSAGRKQRTMQRKKEICLDANAQTDLHLLRYAHAWDRSQGQEGIFGSAVSKMGNSARLKVETKGVTLEATLVGARSSWP